MVQWVILNEPDDLHLMPGIHIKIERENSTKLSSDLLMHAPHPNNN